MAALCFFMVYVIGSACFVVDITPMLHKTKYCIYTVKPILQKCRTFAA